MGSKGPYDWPLHHGTARSTHSAVFENPSGSDGDASLTPIGYSAAESSKDTVPWSPWRSVELRDSTENPPQFGQT